MKKIKTITLSLVLLLTVVAQGADQLVTTCVYCQQYTDSQGCTAPPKKNWVFCGSETWQRGGAVRYYECKRFDASPWTCPVPKVFKEHQETWSGSNTQCDEQGCSPV